MEKILMDLSFENICFYEFSREIINHIPDGKDINFEEFYEQNKPILASYENAMNSSKDIEKLKKIQNHFNIENIDSLNENQIFCFLKDVFLLNIENMCKKNDILFKYINPFLFKHLQKSFKNYHLMYQNLEEEKTNLNNKNDELDKKMDKFIKENAIKTEKIKDLNDKVSGFENKLNNYEKIFENLKSAIKDMKEDYESKIEKLNLKNKNIKEEFDSKDSMNNKKIEELNLKNKNMKEELESLIIINKKEIEDMHSKNLKNEKEIEELKLINKNMKEEFDSKILKNENQIKMLQNFYEYYETENKEVRKYLREEMIKNDKIEKINKNISEKNIELCNNAQKKDYKIKELESIIDSLKEEKNNFEKYIFERFGIEEEEEEGDSNEKSSGEKKLRRENIEMKKEIEKIEKENEFLNEKKNKLLLKNLLLDSKFKELKIRAKYYYDMSERRVRDLEIELDKIKNNSIKSNKK